jgi:hypothetical protein
VISLSTCVRAVAPLCVFEVLFWYSLFLLPRDGIGDEGVPMVFGSSKKLAVGRFLI